MGLWFWKIGWKKEKGAEPPAPVVEGDYPLDLTAQVINSDFQKELVISDPDSPTKDHLIPGAISKFPGKLILLIP